MSYAGPNALARAKLAGEVISKRIETLGLQGNLRVDIIGAGSVHFSFDEETSYNLAENGDYRVRTSGIYPLKHQAQQLVDEVMSLIVVVHLLVAVAEDMLLLNHQPLQF